MAKRAQRKVQLKRETKETKIALKLNLDGRGRFKIQTPFGFFNHMLELFSKHSLFDIELMAKGDIEVDAHHTIEDIGICLGEAIDKALGNKKAIERYGFAILPMDESLARVVVDLSGRPFISYQVQIPRIRKWEFDLNLIEEFFQAMASSGKFSLHIRLEYGKNYHHCLEAIFKAFARAMREAVKLNPYDKNVPSTKGKL